MFVGNDVVDLTDPETRLDSLHDRFAERIFTASEREAIFADARPDVALWTHWAAKQSAYKVLRKADPDAVFAHESFRVDFFNRVGGNRLMGAVEHDGRVRGEHHIGNPWPGGMQVNRDAEVGELAV